MVPLVTFWGCVVLTHLVRSGIHHHLGSDLEGKIAELKVEIHRAKDLVASYNHVLEDCERNLVWAKRTNHWAAWVNIVLGLAVFTGLFYLWVLRPKSAD